MHEAKGYFQRSLVTNLFAYNVLLQARTSAPLERINHLPIPLHVDHGPPIDGGGPQRDVETAEMRLSIVVGIFAFGIGVVNDRAETAPPLIVVHCSISRSPSELPKAAIGRRPMASLIATGLPALSSMKLASGS